MVDRGYPLQSLAQLFMKLYTLINYLIPNVLNLRHT